MYDLIVVGAGPAGMAAALAAAESGLAVAVIDEQRQAGGQIFRRPPPEFVGAVFRPAAGYRWAPQLIADFEAHAGIDHHPETTVYGMLRRDHCTGDVFEVAVSGDCGGVILARRIVLATGAFDLPVPFPGWTLPGVMTAGGVQSLLKSQYVVAGDDCVLAGSHPLLFVVADQLVANGSHVSEIAIARGAPTLREIVASRRAVPGHLDLLAESARALARLVTAGVKVSTQTVVTAAHGDDEVHSVEIAKVDDAWNVLPGRRRVDTSLLVLGYGFAPSTELARQIDCAMTWDSPKGGWVVRHDRRMATSVPGVFVAGEPTGVAGAEQARTEGRLAGLAVAQDLGQPGWSAIPAARRAVARSEKFSTVVQGVFEPKRQALADLATAQTLVCRCENVTRSTIDETLDRNRFISTASAVKLQCRSGMGSCQGRYCESAITAIVAAARDRPQQDSGRFTAHLPVKPVPVDALCALDGCAVEPPAQPLDAHTGIG